MSSFELSKPRNARGFTLVEIIITMAVFALLAASVFGIVLAVFQSASTLQDNQNRRDEIVAMNAYLKKKLVELPAQSTLVSYRRGDGEGLVQNGVVLSNTLNAIAFDAKIQANGYYTWRQGSYPVEIAPKVDLTKDDATVQWTALIHDIKAIQWKFQDPNTLQWVDTWTNVAAKPYLIELSIQLAGDSQPTLMDFWIPRVESPSLAPLQPATPHAP